MQSCIQAPLLLLLVNEQVEEKDRESLVNRNAEIVAQVMDVNLQCLESIWFSGLYM